MHVDSTCQNDFCNPVVWLLAICLLHGCWGESTKTEQTGGKTKTSQVIAQEGPAISRLNREGKIAAEWEKPAAVLMLTGEVHGYLEPCGCSETQSGGVSRRNDLLNQLKSREWDVASLDLGGLLKRNRRQDEIKFSILREAMTIMDYKAMALGKEELKFDPAQLITAVSDSTAEDAVLPFVSANVVLFGTPDLGTPAPYRIVQVGEAKFGVTSIFGDRYRSQVSAGSSGMQGLIDFLPAAEKLKSAVETLKQNEVDAIVVLSHAPASETEKLIKEIPGIDIAVTSGGPEDPSGRLKKVEQTMVLEVGRKGKYAGVLGYFPDQENKFLFELVDLNKDRFKRTEQMEQLMASYQELLTAADLVHNEPALPTPNNDSYVGAKACGECHTKAYEKWAASKHAHATETLIHGREGYAEAKWVSRIHDPECLACHSTGWDPQQVIRYDTGYLSLDETAHLTGQSCENCHGPGGAHSTAEKEFLSSGGTPSEELLSLRSRIKLNLATAEQQVCSKCHDAENSPKFDFAKYWEKVVHRGKD